MLMIIILMSMSIYLIIEKNIIGYLLLGQALNMLMLQFNVYNNLLEQSIVLTSIVIGLGMSFLLLRK